MCLESTHLGIAEMNLLYDVTQVRAPSAIIGDPFVQVRKLATNSILFSLQVPFTVVSPRHRANMGQQVSTLSGEGAYTYLVGQTGDAPVSVVIGYNGTDHFSPTITTGQYFRCKSNLFLQLSFLPTDFLLLLLFCLQAQRDSQHFAWATSPPMPCSCQAMSQACLPAPSPWGCRTGLMQ